MQLELSFPEPVTRESSARLQAEAKYADDSDNDVEIDEDAAVSFGDGGAWVAAWVWVAGA